MEPDFDALISGIGQERQVDILHPFFINDNSKLWYIAHGSINLSYTQVKEDQQTGALYHFSTYKKNRIFFGLKQQIAGHFQFIALPEEDSVVYEIDIKELTRKVESDCFFKYNFVQLLNRWIISLIKAIDENNLFDKQTPDVLLGEGSVTEVAANKLFSTNEKILWYETDRVGDLLFNRQIPFDGDSFRYFPITKRTLYLSQTDVRVEKVLINDIISKPGFWGGIESFHQAVLECIWYKIDRYKQFEKKRLLNKHFNDNAELEAVHAKAKHLLIPEKQNYLKTIKPISKNPIFKAIQIIAKFEDFNLVLPPELKKSQDVIGDICRHSSIRHREISLADDWYDHIGYNALLAFDLQTNIPYAIIPRKEKKYDVYDVEGNTSFQLNAHTAHDIGFKAYMFYKPLPNKQISFKSLNKMIFRLCKKDLKMIGLMMLGVSAMGLLWPILSGILYDFIIPDVQHKLLIIFSIGILITIVARTIFEFTKNLALVRIAGSIKSNLQVAIWDRLLELPTSFFKKYAAGDLVDRSFSINKIADILADASISVMFTCLFLLVNFVICFAYSPFLTLVCMLVLLVQVLIILALGFVQLKHQRAFTHQQGKLWGLTLQLFTGIATFRITGSEKKAFVHWFNHFLAVKKTSIRSSEIQNLQIVFNSSITLITTIVLFATTTHLSNALTTGEFLTFTGIWTFVNSSITTLSNNLVLMFQVYPLFEHVKPILDELPENTEVKSAPERLKGNIEISNVVFRYLPDEPIVLRNISLSIKTGEFIAFVGPSGCGKSTIVRLLLGFEKMQSGSIYYDNQDVQNVDLKLLRRQIGVVLQDDGLLTGDIYSNIVGSSTYLTMDDAWEAARAAALDTDIEQMPMKMRTMLSEGSKTISGGQRQRILIARAIVHKPKILIFDEATSALDNRTQAIVTQSLNNLQVTRIVVAHRISTIKNADRICFMKDGEIKEVGTYDELIKLNGGFAKLADRQIE